MAAIKRFFQKKKMDIKFKTAGTGHKLADESRESIASSSSTYSATNRSRVTMTSEQQRAAEAAMSRMSAGPNKGPALGTSAASVKLQAKRELEAEKAAAVKLKKDAEIYGPPKEVNLLGAPMLAVDGVYYRCAISDKLLPKKEMEAYINEFLVSQLPEEPEMTSALMIHTLNKFPDKCKVCMETLIKYIDNIVEHPGEEKFRKIRINNKAFQERVANLHGTQEFLQAAGFERKILPGPNGVDEEFYAMDEERGNNIEKLITLKEILQNAEPIIPELDRNIKVFYPSKMAQRMEVPPDFFSISAEELKKEQQLKQEAAEKLGMLRTKEMRERERIRELRRYRYCLIRIRFPDGILIQGTFKAHEKVPAVLEVVREILEIDWIPFELVTATGQKLDDDSQTLAELGLAPAALLNIRFDSTVLADIAAQQRSSEIRQYLKQEYLEQIQSL